MYKLSPRNKSKRSVSTKSTINNSDRALTQILKSSLRSMPLAIVNKGKQYRPKCSRIWDICQGISNQTARISRHVVVPNGSYRPENLRDIVSCLVGYRDNQINTSRID